MPLILFSKLKSWWLDMQQSFCGHEETSLWEILRKGQLDGPDTLPLNSIEPSPVTMYFKVLRWNKKRSCLLKLVPRGHFFNVKGQPVKNLRFVDHRSLLELKLCLCNAWSSHRQHVKKWAWLCSDITLFTKTEGRPNWSVGYSLPTSGLNHW